MILKTQHIKNYELCKAVFRGKFIALNAFNIKEEISPIKKSLNFFLKKLEEGKTQSKANRRQKIMKIALDISK